MWSMPSSTRSSRSVPRPSDPSYGRQWSLAKIHAPEAWDTCHGGNEVVVAIIDTGVDYNHRDLQGNLWVNEAELQRRPGRR